VLDDISLGDCYYEESHVPPFDSKITKIAAALGGISLEGVCKVTVSFVRDPLTAKVCMRRSQASLEDASRAESADLFDNI